MKKAKEWRLDLGIYAMDDRMIPADEIEKLYDTIIAWAEERQLYVGGGVAESDDLCTCSRLEEVILLCRYELSPIVCSHCFCVVPFERVQFPKRFESQLKSWQKLYESLYTIWLDSDAYERLGFQALNDPQSVLNRRGFALQKRLQKHFRTWYWWFQDTTREIFKELQKCPVCEGYLEVCRHGKCCMKCQLIME